MRTTVLLFASIAALVACGGHLHDVIDAHQAGDGTARTYAVAPARAWDLAHEICRAEGAERFEDHQTENYFLATIDSRTIPPRYGAFIGVWIAPSGNDASTVSVVTKRTESTFGKGLTEGTFHDELAKRAH